MSEQDEDFRALKKRRLDVLPPAIVSDYAPYARNQLSVSREIGVRRCAMQWDNYYKNNTLNGYKDRHYILREFVELAEKLQNLCAALSQLPVPPSATTTSITLVEIGCGVGNAVLPLLHEYAILAEANQFNVFGFDISQVAVDLLQRRVTELGLCGQLHCIQHDLAEHPISVPFLPRPADFGTVIFVLSSVPVDKHDAFVAHIRPLMLDGGVLMVRDYCAEDLAQKRFGVDKRVDTHENTYARSNGTLSHFFTLEEFVSLFRRHGFEPIDVRVVERQVANRKELVVMERRWLHGRFRKIPGS